MELFKLINPYIRYVYVVLGIVVIILLIVLSSNTKTIKKGLKVSKLYINSFKNRVSSIKEDKEKLDYTSKNTLPFVAFEAISIGVLFSSIKENRKNKKGVIKNIIAKYNKVNKVLNPNKTGKYVKIITSNIKKMV